jgi:hypothetical protein
MIAAERPDPGAPRDADVTESPGQGKFIILQMNFTLRASFARLPGYGVKASGKRTASPRPGG